MSEPLKVVFRKWQDGGVIAVFCHSKQYCNPGNVMTYERVGQHSEAVRSIGQNLKLATPDEYEPLLKELQGIYGEVIPVKRLVA